MIQIIQDQMLLWFALGCMLGFAVGYFVRAKRDVHDVSCRVDRLEAKVNNEESP